MKLFFLLLAVTAVGFSSSAQTKKSTTQLVKQDTILLQADECDWIIKPLATRDSAASIPQLLLTAIENGSIKAVDVQTNQPIPAKDIYTWRLATVQEQVLDSTGNVVQTNILQPLRTAEHVTQINVCQRWYFDDTTKKFHAVIQWIELLEQVYFPDGEPRGFQPFCRIYY